MVAVSQTRSTSKAAAQCPSAIYTSPIDSHKSHGSHPSHQAPPSACGFANDLSVILHFAILILHSLFLPVRPRPLSTIKGLSKNSKNLSPHKTLRPAPLREILCTRPIAPICIFQFILHSPTSPLHYPLPHFPSRFLQKNLTLPIPFPHKNLKLDKGPSPTFLKLKKGLNNSKTAPRAHISLESPQHPSASQESENTDQTSRSKNANNHEGTFGRFVYNPETFLAIDADSRRHSRTILPKEKVMCIPSKTCVRKNGRLAAFRSPLAVSCLPGLSCRCWPFCCCRNRFSRKACLKGLESRCKGGA